MKAVGNKNILRTFEPQNSIGIRTLSLRSNLDVLIKKKGVVILAPDCLCPYRLDFSSLVTKLARVNFDGNWNLFLASLRRLPNKGASIVRTRAK